jgi:hypothetical protein
MQYRGCTVKLTLADQEANHPNFGKKRVNLGILQGSYFDKALITNPSNKGYPVGYR